MAGSSVGAMVVGTVFIMVFGMATMSLVESVDESIKHAEYTLPNPEVELTSITDRVESSGPAKTLSLTAAGSGYTDATTCATTSDAAGTDLTLTVEVTGGEVTGYSAITNQGSGYAPGDTETITVTCEGDGGDADNAQFTVTTVEDLNTITIKNTGSETVKLDHIFITLSDKDGVGATMKQGTPFKFTSEYSGSNLFLYPGEELSTNAFPLDSTEHGFSIDEDPDRAFLAIYDYNSAEDVTIE